MGGVCLNLFEPGSNGGKIKQPMISCLDLKGKCVVNFDG